MSKAINYLELRYLQNRGATSTNLGDAWGEFTKSRTPSLGVSEGKEEWLTSKGATHGSLGDKWGQVLYVEGIPKGAVSNRKYKLFNEEGGSWLVGGLVNTKAVLDYFERICWEECCD